MRYRYILVLLIALAACQKKKYPESMVIGEPTYSFKLNVGGEDFTLEAGKGYYMATGIEKGPNLVDRFKGELRPTDCASCGSSFQLIVNDCVTNPFEKPTVLDSLLAPRKRPFITNGGVNRYSVKFTAAFNKGAAGYRWDFGDGSISTAAAPVHEYQSAGKYNVCVSIRSAEGCFNTICNTVEVGGAFAEPFISTASFGDSLSFSVSVASIYGPYSFDWKFGDGRTSQQQNPIHLYTVRGSYPVVLNVKDRTGKVTQWNYNAVSGRDSSSCAANFHSKITFTPNVNFSSVEVKWTDPSGKVFTSVGAQPSTSVVEILSAELAGQNEKGESIALLRVRMNCALYNGNEVKQLNGTGSIAVGYRH